MARKPVTVPLPPAVAAEINDVVSRTQRSPAFVVLRALLTGADAPPAAASTTDATTFALLTDDDDPPLTLVKITAAAQQRGLPLGEAISAAWAATRERFFRWADREVALRASERADDLDAGLREAAAPSTAPERLAQLATSAYPRIRALVAAHLATPPEVRERLAQDREPYVREAAVTP